MLTELNDHLDDAKQVRLICHNKSLTFCAQQLDAAIQLRDSKLDLVKDLPSTSFSLATEADLHEYQNLQVNQ